MYVILVQLKVKEDRIEEFLKITLNNAENARKEAGCLRFDVHRNEVETNRFIFYEVYRKPEDHKAHQETAHYLSWRDNVPSLLAEPRVATRYRSVSPRDADW